MSTEHNELMDRIKQELAGLAKFVDQTRKGLDTLETAVRMGTERFPEASTQLSTLTGELESAANSIMTILEGLMDDQERAQKLLASLHEWAAGADPSGSGAGMIKELQGINAKAKSNMMDIFTNMSFHDLSGQKLKKVIASLSLIQSKVLELAVNFGFTPEDGRAIIEKLNSAGPAALNQDLVDKIMRELTA